MKPLTTMTLAATFVLLGMPLIIMFVTGNKPGLAMWWSQYGMLATIIIFLVIAAVRESRGGK